MGDKTIDALIAKAQKEFGSDNVRRGGETLPIEAIPTGILSLDYALGVGGYPRGGITMIFGPESVGKSALAYMAIGEVHRRGGYAALVDLEGGFQPDWAANFGVDPDKLVIMNPISAEDTMDHAVFLSNEPAIDLLIVDSIGAMISEKELDDDGKKQAYGQSGLITSMVKKLLPRIARNNQACILLNQARETSNPRGLPIVHPPGGRALRHSCAIIIQLKTGSEKMTHKFENEKDPLEVGFYPIATTTKNKVAEPKRNATWAFYHTDSPLHPKGVDKKEAIVNTAMRMGLIVKSGGYYSAPIVGLDKNVQGKTGLEDWLIENNKLEELEELVLKELRGELNGNN